MPAQEQPRKTAAPALAGMKLRHLVVATERGFRAALAAFSPDVILADHTMPGFSGMAALGLARELRPEVPFIFVSGTLGEEAAIGALKEGAIDYVLKGNLARLPAAVERAISITREHQATRTALREVESD